MESGESPMGEEVERRDGFGLRRYLTAKLNLSEASHEAGRQASGWRGNNSVSTLEDEDHVIF